MPRQHIKLYVYLSCASTEEKENNLFVYPKTSSSNIWKALKYSAFWLLVQKDAHLLQSCDKSTFPDNSGGLRQY